ncbi:DUF3142 domain-containing protein [Sphingobium sp. Sx8-8]|uniref:DUF3142 domain-containing protein n=1 Tax=Sphingobium sp. Sx8-8 TaxID=2933617 RepID=UPI001F584E38|nr:DUF3142 domain-containing protein [Sphingobium sp. Sx8-8]
MREYARFLKDLRARLPNHWRLSVTGLMDWSAHGDPHALVKLAGIIDEVVVQTYQGRTTIPGYGAYFRRMDRFPHPFSCCLGGGGRMAGTSHAGATPSIPGLCRVPVEACEGPPMNDCIEGW